LNWAAAPLLLPSADHPRDDAAEFRSRQNGRRAAALGLFLHGSGPSGWRRETKPRAAAGSVAGTSSFPKNG
jgi:hypothetical protein